MEGGTMMIGMRCSTFVDPLILPCFSAFRVGVVGRMIVAGDVLDFEVEVVAVVAVVDFMK